VASDNILKYAPRNIPAFVKSLLSEKNKRILGDGLTCWTEMCSFSLSANGWGRYKAAWWWYKNFCRKARKSPKVPLSKARTRNILLWNFREQRVSSKTAETYLSALKFIGKLVSVRGRKLERKFLLRGGKNRESLTVKKDPVLPMTLGALNKLKENVVKKNWKGLTKKTFWTCALVAFWGAFRIGELLAKTKWEFDPFSDLTWREVKLKKKRLEIRIKSPKVGGRDVLSRIFAIDEKDFCAVRAMKRLKNLQIKEKIFSEGAPVFRIETGENLTRGKFGKMVKACLTKEGKGHYGGKSFRAGIPSEMESLPKLVSDQHVKNWGHWRSNAYQLYMKNDLPQQKWIFKKLSKEILNRFYCRGKTEPTSQEEGSHLQRLGGRDR
jgi:hypothetical protein